MKAYLLKRAGRPEVLKLAEVPDPVPGPGEVLISLDAIGLNYAEILSRKGLYGWAPKRPYIPGMEGAGTIIALGDSVQDRQVGQKVMTAAQYGMYAEKISVPAMQALPVIDNFDQKENAAFLVNFMTAYVALFKMAHIRACDNVLITAAAGGVGTAAVQLAAKIGARVTGLVGSDAKVDLIRSLGAENAMNYRDPDFWTDFLAPGRRFDIAVEVVGGKVFRTVLDSLAPFGRLVVVGFAGLDFKIWHPLTWYRTWRDIPRAGVVNLAEKSLSLSASHLGYLFEFPDLMNTVYDEMCRFVNMEKIKPHIGTVLPFDQLAEAHKLIESRQSVGKVVLEL